MKRLLALILSAALLVSLCSCSAGDAAAVYVQSVAQLSNLGGIAPGDRFAGIVVSENVAQIKKDEDKTIAELFVKEGDDVAEGQELFRYDTDQLQLELDRKNLELDQLKLSIENYKSQIAELESQRITAGSDKQLEYTVQIQTVQLDLKEAELNLKAKQTEVIRPRPSWKMPQWWRPSAAVFSLSTKTATIITAIPCPILPFSRPVPSASRAFWASCSKMLSWWEPGSG